MDIEIKDIIKERQKVKKCKLDFIKIIFKEENRDILRKYTCKVQQQALEEIKRDYKTIFKVKIKDHLKYLDD